MQRFRQWTRIGLMTGRFVDMIDIGIPSGPAAELKFKSAVAVASSVSEIRAESSGWQSEESS